jgi:hypothetical protein
MTLLWSRLTEEYIRFPVTPVLVDGTPAIITGVDCAMLPYRSRGPNATTVWKAASFTAGSGSTPASAKVLVSGPDASDPGSSGFRFATTDYGGDLWARVTDTEVDPEFIVRIDLIQD